MNVSSGYPHPASQLPVPTWGEQAQVTFLSLVSYIGFLETAGGTTESVTPREQIQCFGMSMAGVFYFIFQ